MLSMPTRNSLRRSPRRYAVVVAVVTMVMVSSCDISLFMLGKSQSTKPQSVAVQTQSTSATVTWSPPRTGDPVREYKVQYATSSKQWTVLPYVSASKRSQVVKGLKPGTKYYFRVSARYAHGHGKTEQVVATTTGSDQSRPEPPATAPPTTAPPTTAPPTTAPPTTAPPTTAPPAPPTTAPPAPPVTGADCAASHPNNECTGAPTTRGLQVHNGDLTISQAGTVIDGWHVTGMIRVRAANVTIRNSVIHGGVDGWREQGGTSFVLTDSTIGRADQCLRRPAVTSDNYTALRNRIVGFGDAFWVSGSNVLIEGNYATMCEVKLPGTQTVDCSWHSDGVQALNAAGARNININRNVLDMRRIVDPCQTTCPVFVPTLQNPGITVNIRDNVVAGGEDGICIYERGAGSFPDVTGNLSVQGSHERQPMAVHCGNVGNFSGNAIVRYDFETGRVLQRVQELNLC